MLSPDCVVGKHVACSGDSWSFEADATMPCPCYCHITGVRLITEMEVREVSLDTEPNAYGESVTVVPATVTAIGRSHPAEQSFKIGPEQLIVVPYCEGSGNAHQLEPCEEHGWALVDPGEDDGPVLQTDFRDVADYVAKIWNADHGT